VGSATARGLFFEDWKVGDESETAERTVTQADIARFAEVSGDANPIHLDPEFAASTLHRGPVAHGLLTLSLMTGLIFGVGTTVGTILALGSIRARFTEPVRPGDVIRAKVRVTRRRAVGNKPWGLVERRCTVRNQRDEIVLECTLMAAFRRRD
jgi:3-hydroxybutyryl-CoA dehydratase